LPEASQHRFWQGRGVVEEYEIDTSAVEALNSIERARGD
jgi:hypothetical protein